MWSGKVHAVFGWRQATEPMSDFITKIKIYKSIYQLMGNVWNSAELHSQGQLGMGYREILCEGFLFCF